MAKKSLKQKKAERAKRLPHGTKAHRLSLGMSRTQYAKWLENQKKPRNKGAQKKHKKIEYQKFAIICDPRSGTHMVRRPLNKHPQIHMSRELFNPGILGPQRGIHPHQVFENWFNRNHPPGTTVLGSVLHRNGYWTETDDYRHEVWTGARKYHTKFVCIWRENTLKQFLSEQVAIRLKNWDCRRKRRRNPNRFRVNVEKLSSHIDYFSKMRRLIDESIEHRITVTYEQFCSDWEESVGRVFDFLELPRINIVRCTQKQELRSVREIIKNYDEVEEMIRGRGLEHWLQ